MLIPIKCRIHLLGALDCISKRACPYRAAHSQVAPRRLPLARTPFQLPILSALPIPARFATALLLAWAPMARASSYYTTPYTFSTVSGVAGLAGSANGQGTAALFNSPSGIALDGSGNLYVADSGSGTIRKITPTGLVTTFAGSAGKVGSQDGTGASAQFGFPDAVAVDGNGNLYVSDSEFNTIRKITPAGVVTTFAGTPGITGDANGVGSAAQFNKPAGVGVDGNGNVYVADSGNQTIRKITSSGTVTTLAGTAGVSGTANGSGASALFNGPDGIACDSAGNVYVSEATNTIRRITPAGVVSAIAGDPGVVGSSDGAASGALFYQPASLALDQVGNLYVADTFNSVIRMVTPGGMVTTLAGRVVTEGSADGTGATALFNQPTGIAVGASGIVFVADTNNNTIRSGSAAPPGSSPPRLINISTRAQVGSGSNLLIPGFVIRGPGMETLLIRAVGPSLGEFNVTGLLDAPVLTVFDSTQTVIASNAGWGNSFTSPQIVAAEASVGAFPLGDNTTDCAVIITVPAGNYTAQVSSGDGTTGVALAEVYEMKSTGTRLVNISTRAQVGTGGNVLIPGFVISGSGTENLLLRADGPSLTQFQVNGVLAQPVLRVADTSMNVFDADTGWSTNLNAADIAAAAAAVGAFDLPQDSADSATLITLSPGTYTMEVSGVNDTTGVALAEVYELP
jgi:sugar lactone lactonase YvrE